ncbi:MAG TPA: DUF4124 domain-containing protein, partial [Methylotenera sp.]|nr:DUF4124 domain-containing protein [Methylotenera sp.]
MLIKIMLVTALISQSNIALAQVYKCKNSKGKITYSESACPSNAVGNELIIDPNILDSSESRRQVHAQKNYQIKSSNNVVETNTDASYVDFMSNYQKETRIRELKIDMTDETAYYEKRADAKNEFQYVSKSNVKYLSQELELKRRNFKVD